MQSFLAILDRVIKEHRIIREHMKLTGETVNDVEALINLRRSYSSWSQSAAESLVEKQRQLEQTINLLNEGLNNHYSFEEAALPPIFGELLMKALIYEHKRNREKIKEAKAVITGTKLEGASRGELLAQKPQIQEVINNLCQMIEAHGAREETILGMLKIALEAEEAQPEPAP